MVSMYLKAAGAVLILAILGGLYALGNNTGYKKRDLMCKAEVAAIESRAIEAERQAGALREKSRILADKLAQQAATAQAQLDEAHRRAKDEIDRRTSATRRALDAQLVGMLNNLTPIRESSGGEASASAARASASVPATAADSAGSSERAVVRAFAECRVGYESCRLRHSALAEYVESIFR